MQLMPSLAAELHAELLGEGYDPDWLYQPGYNAWLGTTELGRLGARFVEAGYEAELALIIAAYNGGEEAVMRWLSEVEGPLEIDQFTENIGYTETRRYVKRVLGYLAAYRLVYGEPEE
jgi:soluble lytic murein transglycosylase